LQEVQGRSLEDHTFQGVTSSHNYTCTRNDHLFFIFFVQYISLRKNEKQMKLQLLVPHYKESEEVIKPFLDSLITQQNIKHDDYGVIITDDGDECAELSEDFLQKYPYEILHFKNIKSGVSATRNYCLEKATADYVMFCDADDMFLNNLGLFILFREIENGGFDGLISTFTEETRDFKDKTKIVYLNHDFDFTFVHGKVYNRKFLVNNDLKFNPNLTIHEDSYFNFLCQKVGTNIKHCPMPFYLWKWRDESVCRHDPKYILKTYNNMIESNTALVNELKKRGKIDATCEMVVQMVFDAYFTMNKKEWLEQENQEYRNATEFRFKKYYEEFKVLFDLVVEEKKNQIIMGIKNRMFGEGMVLEKITFDDWIKHITEM